MFRCSFLFLFWTRVHGGASFFITRGRGKRVLFREDSGHIRLAEHLPGFVHFLKMLTTTKRLLMRSIATLCIATVFLARAEGTDYYTHYPKGCVNGMNILKFTGKTVEQCKEICSAMSNCVAFEFGVAYGGARGNYQPGDCQPQSSTSRSGCDAGFFNKCKARWCAEVAEFKARVYGFSK